MSSRQWSNNVCVLALQVTHWIYGTLCLWLYSKLKMFDAVRTLQVDLFLSRKLLDRSWSQRELPSVFIWEGVLQDIKKSWVLDQILTSGRLIHVSHVSTWFLCKKCTTNKMLLISNFQHIFRSRCIIQLQKYGTLIGPFMTCLSCTSNFLTPLSSHAMHL